MNVTDKIVWKWNESNKAPIVLSFKCLYGIENIEMREWIKLLKTHLPRLFRFIDVKDTAAISKEFEVYLKYQLEMRAKVLLKRWVLLKVA